MDKKISIITVVLNNKNGLQATMDSVFAQTYKNYEYIVIDGGSTDGSCNVIKQHEEKLHYWSSERDRGIYQAMNKGWHRATGEYCIFLNSGDYFYTPDSLKNVVAALDDDMDVIYGDVMFKYQDKMVREVHEEELTLYKLYYTNIPHQGTFIKRSYLELLNGYDENYKIVSDWLFLVKGMIEHNLKIKKINQVISVFDMYGISNAQTHAPERLQAIKTHYPFLVSIFKDFNELRQYKLSSAHKLTAKLLKFKSKLLKRKV